MLPPCPSYRRKNQKGPSMPKRQWSPEARAAAAERMRKISAERWSRAKEQPTVVEEKPIETGAELKLSIEEVAPTRRTAPEVQAVLDTMTPERRAKLASVQARTMATGFVNEHERTEAMERAQTTRELTEAPPALPLPPSRIGSREVSIIVRTDGTCVSQWGPCLCGRPKREWHVICAKPMEVNNGY